MIDFRMRKILVFMFSVLIFGCKSETKTQILELNQKAQNFVNEEKFEDAIKVLNEIEIIDPNYKYIHGTKAGLYMKANKFKEAKAEINKELKEDSLVAEVWMTKGIISSELKEIDDVNLCFKKSIKFYELGKSYACKNENDLVKMRFHLFHVVDDAESKFKKAELKLKWKLDYKMTDHFKFIESETPKKALLMLYK